MTMILFLQIRPKKPKIELAKCQKEIKISLSFKECKQFAKHFDIPKTTICNYKRGLQKSPCIYATDIYRFEISIDWFFTSKDKIFTNAAKAKAENFKVPIIPAKLIKSLDG
ncbi:hypothetical protein [Bartonella henselae]|uniref:hypothetical protein n=1 Tax=Bartonella henselae TaxID=38323 RepID=UPI000A6CEB02|nr:hypothetical protein [Bartonella henselae]